MDATTTNANLTVKQYAYNVSAAVANAILVTLGVGLLLQSMANIFHIAVLAKVGLIAQDLLAPAIGMAVASQLRVNTLVMASAMIASTVGANAVHFTTSATNGVTATGAAATQAVGTATFATGQPVSAVAAALVAVLVGKYLTNKTPLDMILVPFAATVMGAVVAGLAFAYVTTPFLVSVSNFIAQSMQQNAVLGSICVAVAWGAFVLTPASSAALAIALMLDPMSSAAALVGTTAQFVGFFVMSYRQNNAGANVAQLIVTPKVQFPNLLVNPWLVVPPMVAAMVSAPLAVAAFGFKSTYTLGGLGLNSLIAPLAYLANMPQFCLYMVFGVVLPAAVTLVVYGFMKRLGMVAASQLHLEVV